MSPRKSRLHSESGVYHIILRGIGRMNLFEEDADRQLLIRMLEEVQWQWDASQSAPWDGSQSAQWDGSQSAPPGATGTVPAKGGTVPAKGGTVPAKGAAPRRLLTLYAYCLMSNHIHLLAKEHLSPDDYEHLSDPSDPQRIGISAAMHRLGRKYSMYYNKKYGRTGPMFDDRFKSEPVEDMQYFLTVFRYIHRNPVKAGICADVADYPWSSWSEYTTRPEVCHTAALLTRYTLAELTELVSYDSDVKVMDFEDDRPVLSDAALRQYLTTEAHCHAPADFLQLPPPERQQHLLRLHDQGATIAQLARATSLTYKAVRYALHIAGRTR